MRENIEWLIGKYKEKIEDLERDGKSQSIGLAFINRQIRAYKIMVADLQDILDESEETQPNQTDNNCLDFDFDFDKVKEILKKDDFDNLIVDHTCEKKQEQTRDEKIIDAIDFAIKATDSQDDYSMGMRNGMRYVKSLIDGKEPQYELRRTNEAWDSSYKSESEEEK